MNKILAQAIEIPGVTGTLHGPLDNRFTDLASVVNRAMPILMSVAGIALLLYLIWGGFDYLTAMGDPKKAEKGKTRITQAVIGFFIIFAAYWIVQLVAFVFGLEGGPIGPSS